MAKQAKATAAETGNRREGESLRRKLISLSICHYRARS
jgi:hypothetical protein